MFSRKKVAPAAENKSTPPKKSGNAFSIIASDMTVIGDIHSDGTVDIDGRVEGNVRCQMATIRKNGHIKGDLVAETISIYGKVQGLVKARSVNFFKGCKVEGVIHHETITIEDGAFVDGRFKRADQVVLDATPQNENTRSRHPLNVSGFQTPNFLPEPETIEHHVSRLLKDESDVPEEADDKPAEKQDSEKPSLRMLDNLKLIGDPN
ncbi:MAG: polymer-forming cytoskeletal protein [Alphaproteobacteria bacterium]|nr:polymer-forming cytoskeletal protein [Alphaproteobacteria bacterium]